MRDEILHVLRRFALASQPEMTSADVSVATRASLATVRGHLELLCASGEVERTGRARPMRYRIKEPRPVALAVAAPAGTQIESGSHQATSDARAQIKEKLDVPLLARDPVTYQRGFVDAYVPNTTWLMPQDLAEALYRTGCMQGQEPGGVHARKVLEQLLIDLSFSSSRLEGNQYSLLATEELFERGPTSTDTDTLMLLNHKAAIKFLIDAAPVHGLTTSLIRNMHAVLMQDLLAESDALGAIRTTGVHISGTVYVPAQVPAFLEEMLEAIIEKARDIKNPIEASLFLWLNLAYLQPFEDGNKRTSRLAANIPLMLANCSPLSFLDVDVNDYARAMLGVYEFCDVALAVDLYLWTYRRSLVKYAAVNEAPDSRDPLR